ncbi:rhomboid-related protein 1 isoform X2 [Cricetulus griseus]|uniref:Rhomboid-related protein 1 n=2 Tax=Cricetulus griseus TaxID=10029 RepID=A0A9J7H6M3_CRIGR|nr:rhomboid-related protein 1 isoform X2 [Cricetulus griseus]
MPSCGSGSSCLVGDRSAQDVRESRRRVRVLGTRVLCPCTRRAGISVTLSELGAHRAEQVERAGRGGAERSAEQPLPASADPGPRPGSMDRSSLLQLIQEQGEYEVLEQPNQASCPARAWEQAGSSKQALTGPEVQLPSQPGSALWLEVGPPSTPPPQQLDPENTGFIGADTFAGLVHSHELPLDPTKLDMLVALAQSNERGQVCYQELVDLISSKRSSSFKRAIANGQRALPRDGLLDEPGLGIYKRFVRYVAYEILPCEVDRRWYFYRHRSCPPPVFMASVTLAQIIVFLCYGARLNKWVLQTYHPEYMKSPLVYHPGHRARAWRFLTYMFMHVGLEQLGFNALLQLMIGVPLEMVHGVLRISLLYLAGVLAGSLTVSITDMRAPVVGGSGGVYALCSAHLANVVMNWAGMRCPYKLLRMVLALVCMSSEVGRAVWLRFSPPLPASGPQPSFMAHLAGAVVGVSMGLTILRSYEERLRDQCGWWVVLLAYGTFLLFAIFWNVFAYDLLGADIPPPP